VLTVEVGTHVDLGDEYLEIAISVQVEMQRLELGKRPLFAAIEVFDTIFEAKYHRKNKGV
jgi:hypothetical protein